MHPEKNNDLDHAKSRSVPPIDQDTIYLSNDCPDNERVNVDIDPEQAQPVARTEIECPPDSGYGWIYVLCVFLINAHTWGINSVRSLRLQTISNALIRCCNK